MLIVILCAMLVMASCGQKSHHADERVNGVPSKTDASFWGDSTAVLISNGLHNGYKISILKSKELCFMHFERGDSISRYCAVHSLPVDFRSYEDSVGIFKVNMDFPILDVDTLGVSDVPGMFFMDVNFDGEEEFVIEHEGYNRNYYACFDLVNGNNKSACPGLLESIAQEPYNNIVGIVGGELYGSCYTVFDRKKKEIYIYESMGCCAYVETWAKYFEGNGYGEESTIKVVKRVQHSLDGTDSHVEVYELQDNTLRKVREFRE